MAGGSDGFSWNSLIDVSPGPIWITPRAVASARGTARAATVTPAPEARCWSIICRGSIRYTWSEHKPATRPGCWSSIKRSDWHIASAEPDHPLGGAGTGITRLPAGPPIGQARLRCRFSRGLWCGVSTKMSRQPPLTRLDSAKSISRYRPPKDTVGLDRPTVSGASRLPAPPASTMPSTCLRATSHPRSRHPHRPKGPANARAGLLAARRNRGVRQIRIIVQFYWTLPGQPRSRKRAHAQRQTTSAGNLVAANQMNDSAPDALQRLITAAGLGLPLSVARAAAASAAGLVFDAAAA